MSYTNPNAIQPTRAAAPMQQFNFNQFQPQLSQPIFPQPSGNIYFVNNSLEVANIPVGVGTSAVLCLSENLIYLKSMQNGMPMILAYRINPLETPISNPNSNSPVQEANDATAAEQPIANNNSNVDYDNLLKEMKQEYEGKINHLETILGELKEKIGGLIECRF